MRRSKFSATQFAGILKDAKGGAAVRDPLRKRRVGRAPFIKPRSKYSGAVCDAKRLRELEEETTMVETDISVWILRNLRFDVYRRDEIVGPAIVNTALKSLGFVVIRGGLGICGSLPRQTGGHAKKVMQSASSGHSKEHCDHRDRVCSTNTDRCDRPTGSSVTNIDRCDCRTSRSVTNPERCDHRTKVSGIVVSAAGEGRCAKQNCTQRGRPLSLLPQTAVWRPVSRSDTALSRHETVSAAPITLVALNLLHRGAPVVMSM